MKRFLNFLLLLAMLLPTITSAEFQNAQKAFFEPKNFLTNPGAENGKQDMTASAGTFTTTTTAANVFAGAVAWSWDASATSQTLRTGLKQLPTGDSCLAKIQYKGGDANLAFKVLDSSANTLATKTLAASTNFTTATVSFVCPASGTTTRISIESTADAAIIYLDDFYLGANYYLSEISQAKLMGTAQTAATASCSWSSSGSAYADIAADTDCPAPTVTGNASAPATKIPGVTFATLPAGEYLVIGTVLQTFACNSCTAASRWTDGTTPSFDNGHTTAASGTTYMNQIIGRFTYSTAQSNVTFRLQGKSSANSIAYDGTNYTFAVQVYFFPSASQQAARVDNTPAMWSGYHSSADCAWARTNAAYGDFSTDASCTFTEITNTNFGTVSSASSTVGPGITFTPPKVGTYWVCAHPLLLVATSNAVANVRLTDGTTVIAEATHRPYTDGANSTVNTPPVCGLYRVTSIASVTLKLQGAQSSGTLNISTAAVQRSVVEWFIIDLTASTPAPLYTNAVTNSSTGVTRMEVAKLNCDSGSAIMSQHGSWVSSIGNVSSGQCTVTLTAGTFSATPYCMITENSNATTPGIMMAEALSSTSVRINCDTNAGADCTAYDVNLLCVGAK